MNKTIFFFIALQFCSIITQSQDFSKEFGKVGRDEIELKQYEKDKSAVAVVLFDIGMSYFYQNEGSFEISYDRKTRIKILSEAGIKWAEIEILFYQEGGIYEKISNIEAYTYNFEDGLLQKTKFDPQNCHVEKINEYWSVKKFALPNVKAGSIIEFKYELISQYIFNLRDWEFQWKIPVVYSEYEVKMIPFYEYRYILQGKNSFDSQVSYVSNGLPSTFGSIKYQDMVHKFAMNNLSAFNDEEFISSINDYIVKIDFQLSKINYPSGGVKKILTTWPELINELLKDNQFGKYISKSEKLASKIINVDDQLKRTSKEKFDYVLSFVKANYNWNKRNSKYSSKSPSDFHKEKYGNSADINLFTIGLLKSIDIEAYPVIISTRENGKIKADYPYSHFFNYVLILANIDGQVILTDATEILLPNARIPVRCINDKGLIIKDDEPEWINLQSNFSSEIQKDFAIYPDKQTSKVDIEILANEYDALNYRNGYGENHEKIKEAYQKDGIEIIDTSLIIDNYQDIDDLYKLKFKLKYPSEIINDKYYILPFLNEIISKNPLIQEKRTYPIDFVYPQKRIYNTIIEIPEGYKAYYLPKPQKISNDLFELIYKSTQEDNQIKIIFYYYFKKPIYKETDYSSIKFYFNEIVKKGYEKVVLSKI